MRILLFLSLILTGFSQQNLTLEQAIQIALNKNFNIQIAKLDVKNADQDELLSLNSFLPGASASVEQQIVRTSCQPISNTRPNGTGENRSRSGIRRYAA